MIKTKFIQMCVHLIRVQNTKRFEGALPSLMGCFKPLRKRKHPRNVWNFVGIPWYKSIDRLRCKVSSHDKNGYLSVLFKMYILKSSQNLAKFTLIIQLIFTFYDELYIAHETSAFLPDTICRCHARKLSTIINFIQFFHG